MDPTQMMMASGGLLTILISLLMMLLPLLLLLIAWRILKWTSSTSHQVTRLTEQLDELLLHFQNTEVHSKQNDFILETSEEIKAQQKDDFDILAATTASGPADEQPDLAAAGAFSGAAEGDDSGFEFPADEDAAFGEFDLGEDAPDSPAGTAAIELGGGDEAFGDSMDFNFELDESEPGGPSLGDMEAAESRDEDVFAAASASSGQLGGDFNTDEAAGAFDTDETAADFGADETAGRFDAEEASGAADEDDRRMEERFDSEFAADTAEPSAAEATAAAPAEEPPAIIQLADDPARPDVSLARCGQCDHKLAYKKTLIGKKARCPSCKSAFVLP
jgi:hypothetical protein